MPAALAPSQLPAATDLRRAVAEHRLSTNPHHFRNEPALHRPFLVLDPATPSTPCPVLVDRTSPLPPPATVPVTYGIHGHPTPSRMVAFTVPPTAPPAFLAVASVSEAALRLPIRAASLLRTTSAVWPDGMSRAVLQSGWRAFVTDAPVSVSHLPPHQSRAFSEALDSFKALLMDDVHRPSNRIRLDPGRVVVIDNHSFPWALYGDGAREVRTISLPELNTPELDTVLLAASRAKLWSGSGKDCPKPPPEEHLFDLSAWPVKTLKQLQPRLSEIFDEEVPGQGGLVFGYRAVPKSQTQKTAPMSKFTAFQRDLISCKFRNQFVQRDLLGESYIDIGLADPDTHLLSTLRGDGIRSGEAQTHAFYKVGATVLMLEAEFTDERVIRAVRTIKPTVIAGLSSNILRFAITCIRKNWEVDTIKRVVLNGELLVGKQRSVFARAFGPDVQLYETYGAEETETFATRAPGDEQFRIAGNTMVAEIVDDEGREVPFGTEGRLVVTSLTRTEVPMVRFDTGDRATMKGPKRDEFTLGDRLGSVIGQQFGSRWVSVEEVNEHVGLPLCAKLNGVCEFQLVTSEEGRKVRLAVYAAETNENELLKTEKTVLEGMRTLFKPASNVEEVEVSWLRESSQLHRDPFATKLLRFVNH